MARTWIEALVANDCELAVSYVSLDRPVRSLVCNEANSFLSARIDEVIVRDMVLTTGSGKEAALVGEFHFINNVTRDTIYVIMERIDGK